MLLISLVKLLRASVLVALCGLSVNVIARDSWVSVRSKHLLVIGNGSEKEIRQVTARLEQFREVVSTLLAKAGSDSAIPTTVIVFKDDASYGPFKVSENNSGYFQPGQDVNYITLSTESRGDLDPFSTIFHEYTHLLVNDTFGKTPAWFNEGLAELYSTLSVSDDQRVVIGRPIRRHISTLQQNSLLPLRTLLEVDYKSPFYNESQKQSIFYAEAWALMHYLMMTDNGVRAPHVLEFLQLLNAHTALEPAFQKAFNTSIESFESALRGYVLQDHFRSNDLTFARKIQPSIEMTSASLSEAEVFAYEGDLLIHSNRNEAETYLLKAVALDPNLIQAHASLGMARYRQGRMSEALPSLERAVEANSQNALVQYYYAAILSRPAENETTLTLGLAPETAAKARAALKNAIALRPDFHDSYNLLAYLNLVMGTDIDETIELLNGVLARSPERNDHRYMLGQLYMHKDDYKQARPLLERVAAGNLEANVRSHAQKLLGVMTEIEELEVKKEEARRARGFATSNGNQPQIGAAANQAINDPSADLREVLHLPTTGEARVAGVLMSIDCEANGLVFVVKTQERTLRLRADSFQQVRRVSFTADVRGTITCGARKPENPVVVCYLPISDKRANSDGVLSSVEFVPREFQLVPPAP
jgi:tetratricopeptide (TPR) repeat protein